VKHLEKQLGQALSAEEVAQYLGLDVKTVRKYHQRLGGIRLGRRFVFFEKEIINAVSKREEMDCPSEERRPATEQGVLDQEGSEGLGSQNAPQTSRRMELEDRHGLFE
jgi:hypothetical protein